MFFYGVVYIILEDSQNILSQKIFVINVSSVIIITKKKKNIMKVDYNYFKLIRNFYI